MEEEVSRRWFLQWASAGTAAVAPALADAGQTAGDTGQFISRNPLFLLKTGSTDELE